MNTILNLSTGNLSFKIHSYKTIYIYICTVSSQLLLSPLLQWIKMVNMGRFGQSHTLSKIDFCPDQPGSNKMHQSLLVAKILLSWCIYCDYNLLQQIREHRNSLRKKIVRSLLWTEFSIPSILLYSRWFGSGDIATHNGHLGSWQF